MKIIHDKEVGEIWEDEINNPPDMFGLHDQIIALIRKLVEERAMRQLAGWKGTDWRQGFDASLAIALSDFGIDPADWKDDD